MFYEHLMREWKLSSEDMFGFYNEIQVTQPAEWESEEKRRLTIFKAIPDFEPKMTENLKQIFRFGIPHTMRRKWWFVASKGLKLLSQAGDVWPSALRSAMKVPMSTTSSFGGAIDLLPFLHPELAEKVRQFLHVVWVRNKHITFSPLIPTVAVLLLLYLEPSLAYLTIQQMINKSTKNSWYFTLTRETFIASVSGFRGLIGSKIPAIYKKASSLGLDIAQIGLALFPVFFLPFTPIHVALTLFDSFVSEGRKILVRFAISLFDIEKTSLLQCETSEDFLNTLVRGMNMLSSPGSTQRFLEHSFKIFLSRPRHIDKFELKALNESNDTNSLLYTSSNVLGMMSPAVSSIFIETRRRMSSDDCENVDVINIGDTMRGALALDTMLKFTADGIEENQRRLQKELAESAVPTVHNGRLLTNDSFYLLREQLPSHISRYNAHRVFSMSVDGTSMISLYEKCSRNSPYLLLIKTAKQKIVGAYIGDPLNPEITAYGRFYGKPNTFVFSLDPLVVYKQEPPPNSLYQSASKTAISIGGPRPAIHIEDGFHVLMSERCETFQSPPLVDNSHGDPILDIELYRLSI